MKLSLKSIIILFITIAITACGPGQILRPTVTTTPTITRTPTATPSQTSTPNPTYTPTQRPFFYVDEPMNLRTGPDVVFEVTGQITPGHTYYVVGKYPGWWLIDSGDGNTGWIFAPYGITNFVGDAGSVPDLPSPPTPSPEPTPTCPAFPPTTMEPEVAVAQARLTLTTFFELLSESRYAEAVQLYSGEYYPLWSQNPMENPKDFPALLKNACESNGYQCLLVRDVVRGTRLSGGRFEFLVEFSNRDGSLFVRGPCCGASEKDMPSQSQFIYSVMLSCDGKYSVTELPVYVP
jgi:hypothetical protein